MRLRTWPVAAVGLAALLFLVAVSLLTASRRAQEILPQMDQLNAHHREVEGRLERLRSDVHLSGIFIRDYLLDPVRASGPEYRRQLSEFRTNNRRTLNELATLLSETGNPGRTVTLERQLNEYWTAVGPLFDRSPTESAASGVRFLRQEVLPRRQAVLAIALEIEQLNDANLAAQGAEVARRHAAFRSDLDRLLWQSVLLGLVVAVSAVLRLRVLERRSADQQVETEEAERLLRQLSQQLVATQEQERKKLSRELHDHVGQLLTALRLELGRIERLRAPGDSRVAEAIAEGRLLVDQLVRTVRDLSLGLRPSMLDDFGLQPALEWLVRDFTRHTDLAIHLRFDGDFSSIRDDLGTCLYRIVQEALTNCTRHAHAARVTITVSRQPGELQLTLTDDGVGIDARKPRTGLGLRGIEERVKELGGSMSLRGRLGVGTTIVVRLPAPAQEGGARVAAAAG